MKRCPQCKSLFPDAENFCELDGTPLVSEPEPAPLINQNRSNTNTILIVGALLGVVLGLLPVLVYVAWKSGRDDQNANQASANSNFTQPQLPAQLSRPAPPVPTPSPSEEPSPSPSPEPSPSPQSTPPPIELSSSPVSTAAGAKDKSGPVIIRLQSGHTIEAEEAWQTAEGIWYRRSGVVALLDPKDVKSVERQKAPSPQPTASPKASAP